jgi:uncharacterized protein (TIGR03067 family)
VALAQGKTIWLLRAARVGSAFRHHLGGQDMARMILAAAVLALLAPAAWAQARKDTKDASKLIGTWTVASAEKDGKTETAANVKGKQVKITRDTITCLDRDGKTEMACRYTVDTSKTPWRLELTCTQGEHKGKKLHGIVSQDGNNLKLCHAKPGGDTPTSFKTKDGQCCFNLERSKR